MILICFAVDSPDSLDNVQEKVCFFLSSFSPPPHLKCNFWINSLLVDFWSYAFLCWSAYHPCWMQKGPSTRPTCNWRTQKDKPATRHFWRGASPTHFLPFLTLSAWPDLQGMAVAQKICAKHYLECSAKSGEGVREVFQYATRAALLSRGKGRKKSLCTVLWYGPCRGNVNWHIREVKYIITVRKGHVGGAGGRHTMDDRRQTRVGRERTDLEWALVRYPLGPLPSFFFLDLYSHLFRPSIFKCPFLSSYSRCQISLAPFSIFCFLLLFLSYFPISLVFEIDAMLPNELLPPPLFIDRELLIDDSTYM